MSKIESIEKIKIGGFPHKIYSASWQAGLASGPSEFSVEFVDEGLDFTKPELGFYTATSITVGGQKLGDFYPISWETRESKNESILSVSFVDKSIFLDRVLVMLKGETGFPEGHTDDSEQFIGKFFAGTLSAAEQAAVIFVGEEIDACTGQALKENAGIDPCNPCNDKYENPELYEFKCKEIEACKRKKYDFSLQELLSELGSVGLSYSLGGVSLNSGEEAYRVNYSGPLRSVLNNICADLGLSFYFFNGVIHFYDLRNGISINDADLVANSTRIIQRRKKKTLEGVKNNVGIAYFGKDCEEKEYECGLGMCKKLQLRLINYKDIFDTDEGNYHFDGGQAIKGSAEEVAKKFTSFTVEENVVIMTMLRRMSPAVRNMIVWGCEEFYGIKKGSDLEELEGKTMFAYDEMKILKVFHPDSEDFAIKARCREFLNLYHQQDQEKITESKASKSYFILARKWKEGAEEVKKREEIMSTFLGRYWFRNYKEHIASANYTYTGPDVSGGYVDFNSPVSMNFVQELLKIGDDEVLKSEFFTENFKKDEGEDADDPSGIGAGDEENLLKAKDTFVLMERAPTWYPTAFNKGDVDRWSEYALRFIPQEVEFDQMPFDYFRTILGEGYKDTGDAYFGLYYVDSTELPLKLTKEVEKHPLDEDNENIRVELCNKKTNYGLRDSSCLSLDVKVGGTSFKLFSPPQVYDDFDDASDPPEGIPEQSGFNIIVSRGGSGIPYYLRKIEVFGYAGFPRSLTLPYSSIDITFSDITQEDFRYIIPDYEDICTYNSDELSSKLSEYVSQFAYRNPAFEERSYSYVGVPSVSYSPSVGVTSANFSIGNSGVITQMNYNNKAPAVLSPDVFLRRLKHLELRKYREKKVPTLLRPNDDQDEMREV